MIELRQVCHAYPAGEPALRDVSLTLRRGEAVALVGETGAGKSTLAQVMAGLIRPTSGEALWDGLPATDGLRRAGRGRAGGPTRLPVAYLFQHPEHQLFEATVFDDVAFGPRNLGLPSAEVERRVEETLTAVGLDPREIARRSPFALSGGEQRRVALAGILALEPEFLLLDEPTAGLDPAGSEGLLARLSRLHHRGTGLLMITHRLDEVIGLVDRILVLHRGALVLDAPPAEALRHPDHLAALGVEPPVALRLATRLRRRGLSLPGGLFEEDELVQAILRALGGAER